ncbi:MAG: hypothetical protein JWP27_597 [Flaviaesturariibacter sp.]|nr:hypothetical protein [Flaviaesturariibacter sp.]
MNEQAFLQVIQSTSARLGINPFLLLSGIEGLYTFRDVPLNEINYDHLDSLILTILALRIGDEFHGIAQENLASSRDSVRDAAATELRPLTPDEISASANPYLQSFATLLAGKAPVRAYHIKALDAAAEEIGAAGLKFGSDSISTLVLGICKSELGGELDLAALFSSR